MERHPDRGGIRPVYASTHLPTYRPTDLPTSGSDRANHSHPVPALRLSSDQRRFSGGEQVFDPGEPGVGDHDHSGGQTRQLGRVEAPDAIASQPGRDARQDPTGAFDAGSGEQQRELVPRVPGDKIRGANLLEENGAEVGQEPVSRAVSQSMVEFAERGDVEQREGKLGAVALHPLELLPEAAVQGVETGATRQRIGTGGQRVAPRQIGTALFPLHQRAGGVDHPLDHDDLFRGEHGIAAAGSHDQNGVDGAIGQERDGDRAFDGVHLGRVRPLGQVSQKEPVAEHLGGIDRSHGHGRLDGLGIPEEVDRDVAQRRVFVNGDQARVAAVGGKRQAGAMLDREERPQAVGQGVEHLTGMARQRDRFDAAEEIRLERAGGGRPPELGPDPEASLEPGAQLAQIDGGGEHVGGTESERPGNSIGPGVAQQHDHGYRTPGLGAETGQGTFEHRPGVAHGKDGEIGQGERAVGGRFRQGKAGPNQGPFQSLRTGGRVTEERNALSHSTVAGRPGGRFTSLTPRQRDSAERLGAHVSTQGGVQTAPVRGTAIGATAIQVFTKGPSQWREPPLAARAVREFRNALESSAIRTVISHDSYLINLASPDPQLSRRSIRAFIAELRRCKALGIGRLVSHPGNYIDDRSAGLERNARNYSRALRAVPEVGILLEGTAGSGTSLGSSFEELAELSERIADEVRHRVGFCLDTCHLYGAGYDLVHDYDGVFALWERLIGFDRLGCIHLNDSKTAFNSRCDRHQLIGVGSLGPEPFRRIMRDPRFQDIPKIIETPKGKDPVRNDRRMLRLLRSYAEDQGSEVRIQG